jgi:hypothetical protein
MFLAQLENTAVQDPHPHRLDMLSWSCSLSFVMIKNAYMGCFACSPQTHSLAPEVNFAKR